MVLEIDKTRKVAHVQKEFSTYFPFLRIEFFDNDTGRRLRSNVSLGHAGHLEIQAWHTAGYVEKLLESRLGLKVTVFRRHGKKWLPTAGTDFLSLKEQNEIGRNTNMNDEQWSIWDDYLHDEF